MASAIAITALVLVLRLGLGLGLGNIGVHVAVPVNHAAMPRGVGVELGQDVDQAQRAVADDQTRALQPSLR